MIIMAPHDFKSRLRFNKASKGIFRLKERKEGRIGGGKGYDL